MILLAFFLALKTHLIFDTYAKSEKPSEIAVPAELEEFRQYCDHLQCSYQVQKSGQIDRILTRLNLRYFGKARTSPDLDEYIYTLDRSTVLWWIVDPVRRLEVAQQLILYDKHPSFPIDDQIRVTLNIFSMDERYYRTFESQIDALFSKLGHQASNLENIALEFGASLSGSPSITASVANPSVVSRVPPSSESFSFGSSGEAQYASNNQTRNQLIASVLKHVTGNREIQKAKEVTRDIESGQPFSINTDISEIFRSDPYGTQRVPTRLQFGAGVATINGGEGMEGWIQFENLSFSQSVPVPTIEDNPALPADHLPILSEGVEFYSGTVPLYNGVSKVLLSEIDERDVLDREKTNIVGRDNETSTRRAKLIIVVKAEIIPREVILQMDPRFGGVDIMEQVKAIPTAYSLEYTAEGKDSLEEAQVGDFEELLRSAHVNLAPHKVTGKESITLQFDNKLMKKAFTKLDTMEVFATAHRSFSMVPTPADSEKKRKHKKDEPKPLEQNDESKQFFATMENLVLFPESIPFEKEMETDQPHVIDISIRARYVDPVLEDLRIKNGTGIQFQVVYIPSRDRDSRVKILPETMIYLESDSAKQSKFKTNVRAR